MVRPACACALEGIARGRIIGQETGSFENSNNLIHIKTCFAAGVPHSCRVHYFVNSYHFWGVCSLQNSLIFKSVRNIDHELLFDQDPLRAVMPPPCSEPAIDVIGTTKDDFFSVTAPVDRALLGQGDDTLESADVVDKLDAGRGDDEIKLASGGDRILLNGGDDTLESDGFVFKVIAGRGDDMVTLNAGGGRIDMGRGDDTLKIKELVDFAIGGGGDDTLEFDFNIGDVDIAVNGSRVLLFDRFTGEKMKSKGFETFEFNDTTLTLQEIRDDYAKGAIPTISVGGGTQTVTVNDTTPTVSVVWDRVVQQAVIESENFNGPTIASRAYSMVHTAMYDAWSAYDDTAVRVSFDDEGDNGALEALAVSSDANKEKAMSFAAFTVLNHLYPEQADKFAAVMQERYGFSLTDDGSPEAAIGIDAAEDLIALRFDDGSNQAGGFQASYTPTNPSPLEINDITAWTPENVPIDPEDASPEQSFLTPQWLDVESFALPEFADGSTDFDAIKPVAPKPFFVAGQSGSTLDFNAQTITLGADVTIGGTDYSAGDVIPVSKDLIGPVINQAFIDQALEVIDFSANLTDEDKIIAEFWEDGGGTAFPPGTFMTFAQFVSSRDDHSIDQDAAMFLAMGNAVMDAGIATWQAKVEYDYARPVRVIRDLGELGLIGEMGVDEVTGETGYVIQAWGGIDPNTGQGIGTKTILAENFVTYQRPGADPSPPFAEYTSGHSAFSASGAEVLRLFTGSDDFGGSVTFEPGTVQFEAGVPFAEETLAWATFTEAADEAGLSRLYGGIHFNDGDINGRLLGRDAGANAYDLMQMFVNGTATDEDRPFWEDAFIFV